ncbi:MAG: hypothetical protein IKO47_09180 [Ruminococcus sp.]|nr:hypothetical protein [Ruminococcus sp.]
MKKNLKALLKNADKDTLNTLAERYPAASDEEREKIYGMIVKKTGGKQRPKQVDVVRGVDIYSRPRWHRTAAAAASVIAAVIGISAVIYSVSRFNAPKDTESSRFYQVEDTSAEPASDANTISEDYIYKKMLHSTENFDRVSGVLVDSFNGAKYSVAVEFEGDLTTACSHCHTKAIGLDENTGTVQKVMELVDYCDGRALYQYNLNDNTCNTMREAYYRGILYNQGETDVTNMPAVNKALIPQSYAMSFLEGAKYWGIVRFESYLGRKCAVIHGETSNSDTVGFWFYVDTETGVILKYLTTDSFGNYVNVMLMKEIAFDNDAKGVITLKEAVDFNGMSKYSIFTAAEMPDIAAVVGSSGAAGFISLHEIMGKDFPSDGSSDKAKGLEVFDPGMTKVLDIYYFRNDDDADTT